VEFHFLIVFCAISLEAFGNRLTATKGKIEKNRQVVFIL